MSLDVFSAEFERSATNYLKTESPEEEKYIVDVIADAFLKDDENAFHEMKIILGEMHIRAEDEQIATHRIWGYETFIIHYEIIKARLKAREEEKLK
ncbi:MAG: hypothetical protein GTN36_02105 [Candidatus Aenigmarchaeota archaeon]|nr:hypothetical protein [Candidatus Aenigmarchaeota archaeon]